MRAIRENRLCVFGPGDSDVVVRPGPAHGRAAASWRAALRTKKLHEQWLTNGSDQPPLSGASGCCWPAMLLTVCGASVRQHRF